MNATDTVLSINIKTASYYKLSRWADIHVAWMYRNITDSLLHDESPEKICTSYIDLWEHFAAMIMENNHISHKQFLVIMKRIEKIVEQLCATMGMEYPYE